MRPVAFLLCFLLIAAKVAAQEAPELFATPPGSPDRQCEDENGNTWNLPLEQYQAGLRPQGPCLPVGTWDRIRDQSDPGWRRRRQDQIDRDLSSVGPETRRVVACHRCVDYGECAGIEKLHCSDVPLVAEHCARCERQRGCKVDGRLGCGTRERTGWEPDGALMTYRRTVVNTIHERWSQPASQSARSAKVSFTIASDGAISDVTIAQSSNDERFDRSATDAVKAAGHLPKPPPGWPSKFVLEFHSVDSGGAG